MISEWLNAKPTQLQAAYKANIHQGNIENKLKIYQKAWSMEHGAWSMEHGARGMELAAHELGMTDWNLDPSTSHGNLTPHMRSGNGEGASLRMTNWNLELGI